MYIQRIQHFKLETHSKLIYDSLTLHFTHSRIQSEEHQFNHGRNQK
jgi:hypothetical protein